MSRQSHDKGMWGGQSHDRFRYNIEYEDGQSCDRFSYVWAPESRDIGVSSYICQWASERWAMIRTTIKLA